jgi:MFS family permease
MNISKSDISHVSIVDEERESNEKEHIQYEPREERLLLRKLDFTILPLLAITYGLLFTDKSTLGGAAIFGLNLDLKLTIITGLTPEGEPILDNSRYSNVAMIFYVGYFVGAYPWSYLCQILPTAKVVSVSCFLWSIITMLTATCKSYEGILVNRFFLGIAEAAVGPAFTVYVTFWWIRREQVVRNLFWYGGVGAAVVVVPLLSYGLARAHTSLKQWQFMYLIIGALSFVWSFVLLFFLPDDPQTARSLSEREKEILKRRLEIDNVGNVNRVHLRGQVWETLRDPKYWLHIVSVLMICIPAGAMSSFTTIVLNEFGFGVFETLLLQLPIGAIIILTIVLSSLIARLLNIRYLMMSFTCLIPAAGSLICLLTTSKNIRYGGVCLWTIATTASGFPMTTATTNAAGHTKKSLIGASTFMAYCVGNILGPIIFASSVGPKYVTGFTVSLVLLMISSGLGLTLYFYLRAENSKRDANYGQPTATMFIDDVTDKQNTSFRYVL